MDVAGLITWLITAIGGFLLLGTWIGHGGHRRDTSPPSRLPAGVVFGHFLLAAVGLVLWIVYVVADTDGLAWPAFAVIAVVALLGFTMFFRWVPQVRERGSTNVMTAEAEFPVSIVVLHGLLAATTLILVLLAATSA